MLTYYQAPSDWATRGIAYSLVLGLPLALLLGYVYTVLMVTLPLVWVLPVIVVLIAYAWSWVLRLMARWLKLYNKKSQLLVGLLSSFVLFYGQWVAFLLYLDLGNLPPLWYYFESLGTPFELEKTGELLSFLYHEGLWTVGGAPINGGLLVLLWVIEALCVIAGPTAFIWKVPLIPYSKNQETWYGKYILEQRFGTLRLEEFTEALKSDPIAAIENAPLGKAGRYRVLELYHLPKGQQNYATIKLVNIDLKGNQESSVAVPPFLMDRQGVKTILERYQLKKERLELF